MFKQAKSSLAITLSVAMVATMVTIPQVASAAPATSTQLSGLDRYKTSLEIVQAGWEEDSSKNVIIASGETKNMADALAAAPLAYKMEEAPILLTKTDAIPAGVLDELVRLGVEKVTIVGGESAVSAEVEAELKSTGVTVERVSGENRFETSLEIAKEAFGTTSTEVVIANGLASADALSISAIAANKGMPILLVNNRTGLTVEQKAYIAGTTQYAVGGTTVLSDAVVGNATRLEGANRYETNAAILAEFAPDYSKIFLAKGTTANLVDALVGSAYAAKGNNPIVLVDAQDEINAKLVTEVTANIKADSEIVRLGGLVTTATSDAVDAVKSETTAQVTAVNDATTQIQLLTALQNELFEGVALESNVIEYASSMINPSPGYATVADISAAVQAINETVASEATSLVVKENLEEAYGNQITVNEILTDNFDAVNSDYIVNYVAAIYDVSTPGSEVVGLKSMSDIQDAIYLENATAAVVEVQAEVTALASDGNDTQADIDAVQTLHDATFDLVDALDPADATLVSDLETVQSDIVIAQDLLDVMNVEIGAADVALDAHLAAGGADDDVEYVALVDELELETKTTQDITDATTDLEDATTVLEDATEALTAVTDAETALSAYETAGGNVELPIYTVVEVAITGGDTLDIQTKTALLEAETAKLVTYADVMSAETATEMKTVLFELGNTNYVNLTTSQKLEFSELFIAAVAEDESADLDAVGTLLGTELTAYTDLISDVNAAKTISEMTTALTVLGNEAFDALLVAEKANASEAVLAGTPDYTTLAEITAAMGL